MTGRRRGTGKQLRRHRRAERFQGLLIEAGTVEQQLNVSFDWFRTAARHVPDREAVMRDMASQLANAAFGLERRPR